MDTPKGLAVILHKNGKLASTRIMSVEDATDMASRNGKLVAPVTVGKPVQGRSDLLVRIIDAFRAKGIKIRPNRTFYVPVKTFPALDRKAGRKRGMTHVGVEIFERGFDGRDICYLTHHQEKPNDALPALFRCGATWKCQMNYKYVGVRLKTLLKLVGG